jgi:hypothetical protein
LATVSSTPIDSPILLIKFSMRRFLPARADARGRPVFPHPSRPERQGRGD